LDTLKNHLLKLDGGCGREGAEMKRLAKATKLSVHMLQSVAMGRRKLSDSAAARLQRALAKKPKR